MEKIAVSLLVAALLVLPAKVSGQTSLSTQTTRSISVSQPDSAVKSTIPEPSDESYCRGFSVSSCPTSRCEVKPSCPMCSDIGCHAKSSQQTSTDGSYAESRVKKIEVVSDGVSKTVKVTDGNGISRTSEPSKSERFVINPDPQKCQPTPCTVMTLKVEDGKTVISEGGTKVTTSLPVKIEESQISVTTTSQVTEVIGPSQVQRRIESLIKATPSVVTVTSIDLSNCEMLKVKPASCGDNQSVYEVKATRQAKLLGIMSVNSHLSYTLNAVTGEVLSEQSPWYLKTFSFLFK